MKPVWFVSFLIVSLFISAEELLLVSDPWCPYTCDPRNESPGFLVEVARKSLEIQGFEIKYELMPWARALQMTRSGKADGIITVDQSDSERLVLNRIPFVATKQVIAVLAKDDFIWDGLEALGERHLLIINGYTYGGAIRHWIEEHPSQVISVSGKNALLTSLEMLSLGRGQAVVNDEFVMRYLIKDTPFRNLIRFEATGVRTQLHIGFSEKRRDAEKLAAWLDQGIERLKESGEFQRLLEKYQMNEAISKLKDF